MYASKEKCDVFSYKSFGSSIRLEHPRAHFTGMSCVNTWYLELINQSEHSRARVAGMTWRRQRKRTSFPGLSLKIYLFIYVCLFTYFLLTYLLTYLLLRVSFPRLSRMRTRILCKEGVTHNIAQNAATAKCCCKFGNGFDLCVTAISKKVVIVNSRY